MRRRDTLSWLVYTTGMLGSAAMPVALSRALAPAGVVERSRHLRPPGAILDDDAFVAACIGCGLCGKCMPVCPTEALTSVGPRDVDMGLAQIDRAGCYPWVDRGICGACVSICPLGESAIGFQMWNQYRPVVRDGCVGCGLCVEVCPHPSRPIKIVERSAGSVATHTVSG